MPHQGQTRWRPLLYTRQNKGLLFGLIGLPVIISLAYFLNLFHVGGVSNRLDQLYVQFVTRTSQKIISPTIRIIYMDEEHNLSLLKQNPELAGIMRDNLRRQLWRKLHAELISKLDRAGAAIVAFDFTFPTADNTYKVASKAFVDAVREANNHGKTHVVIGWNAHEPIDHDLGQVLSTGQTGEIEIGGMSSDTGDRNSLRVIAIAISEGRATNGVIEERLRTPIPMPLQLFTIATQKGNQLIIPNLDASHGDVALFENGTNHLIPTELMFCQADSLNCNVTPGFKWRRTAVLPLIMPSIDSRNEIPYEDVLSSGDLTDYKDKIVIVGARIDEEKITVPGAESGVQLYGYEAHAAILDDLMHDRYPRRVRLIPQLILFCVLPAFALLGRRLLPRTDVEVNTFVLGKKPVPIGLLILIAIYGIVAVVLYSSFHLFLNVTYDLSLLVAAYFVVGQKAFVATEFEP